MAITHLSSLSSISATSPPSPDFHHPISTQNPTKTHRLAGPSSAPPRNPARRGGRRGLGRATRRAPGEFMAAVGIPDDRAPSMKELSEHGRDRDRYVQGDYRFRHGYRKHNPRKMVKTWAEKEMRNLQRIKTAGIRCPKPLLLRHHVLVMEFIGTSGWAAPRLKDAALSVDKSREGYMEIITTIRTLYQKCKLVHGDLSEYNILYLRVTCTSLMFLNQWTSTTLVH